MFAFFAWRRVCLPDFLPVCFVVCVLSVLGAVPACGAAQPREASAKTRDPPISLFIVFISVSAEDYVLALPESSQNGAFPITRRREKKTDSRGKGGVHFFIQEAVNDCSFMILGGTLPRGSGERQLVATLLDRNAVQKQRRDRG